MGKEPSELAYKYTKVLRESKDSFVGMRTISYLSVMNNTEVRQVIFEDLAEIDYKKAWDYQYKVLDAMVDVKRNNRKLPWSQKGEDQKNHLIFCAHPPVYTLGKSGSVDHLLLNEEELEAKGIQYYKINRGGDITFHGPGQIVVYPIFDLECFFTDVKKYVNFLEEVVIRTLGEYGLEGGREEGFTGVWLAATDVLPKRKICAIGVHLRRWVTMHGLAFNVNTDLTYFKNIIPCGISDEDKAVTSLALELGKEIDEAEVKEHLKKYFMELFDFQWINKA